MRPHTQDHAQATRKLRVQPQENPPTETPSQPKRGSWYLLTGLIIGLLFGLKGHLPQFHRSNLSGNGKLKAGYQPFGLAARPRPCVCARGSGSASPGSGEI